MADDLITQHFRAAAAATPERIAVSNQDAERTWTQLDRESDILAGELRAQKVAVVAAPFASGPTAALTLLASLRAGAALMPLATAAVAPPAVRARLLGAAKPDLLLLPDDEDAEAWRSVLPESTAFGRADSLPLPAVRPRSLDDRGWPADTRFVQPTSGTTNAPKLVLLSEGNAIADLDAQHVHFASFAGGDAFCAVPQFHAMGVAVLLELLACGVAVHGSDRFAPGDALTTLRHRRCRTLFASPTWLKLMLRLRALDPTALPDLRAITIGSARVDPNLVAALQAALPAIRLHLRFGVSEAFGALSRLDLGAGEALGTAGHVGPALGDVSWAPLPSVDGEDAAPLRVSAATVGSATIDPDTGRVIPQVDADGYLDTRDLAATDQRGELYLRGRSDTVFKSGGFRILPAEIEQVLQECDGVHEAAVTDAPDDVLGARIVAFVETNPGAGLEETTLQAHCAGHLAAYKAPHRFVLGALPRTASGKPDRARLRAQA